MKPSKTNHFVKPGPVTVVRDSDFYANVVQASNQVQQDQSLSYDGEPFELCTGTMRQSKGQQAQHLEERANGDDSCHGQRQREFQHANRLDSGHGEAAKKDQPGGNQQMRSGTNPIAEPRGVLFLQDDGK